MVYVMRNGRRVIAALSFLLLCCGVHVHAQRVAVKTSIGLADRQSECRSGICIG